MHRVQEIVAARPGSEALIGTTRGRSDRHHAIVGNLDGLDLVALDTQRQIVECDRLDIRGPTLLHNGEEECNDRDQDDQVDEAISQPLGVHAWWDPPGWFALYARDFAVPGIRPCARAGAAMQAQDENIRQKT